jgi:hypothetical protein
VSGRAPRTHARRRRPLPTWRELVSRPELAILGALESAIDVAIISLVAAQPELHPSLDGRDPDSSPAAAAADAVIGHAQVLVAAIVDYRAALHREPDDLPF